MIDLISLKLSFLDIYNQGPINTSFAQPQAINTQPGAICTSSSNFKN